MGRQLGSGTRTNLLLARTTPKRLLFWLLLIGFQCSEAFAGGYAVNPKTAKAASQANAVTAGVDDPSAVYVNPAALSEIQGNQVLGGFTYVNSQSRVANSGRKSINRHDDTFIPTLFGNYHMPANLTLGIGLYTPFGLATTYDADSFTRFAAIRSELKTFYVTPAIAWRPSQYFSLGAGVSFVHSSAVLSRAVFLGGPEGRLRITDADNAFAYNFGLLLKPLSRLKLGFTYRSRVDLDYGNAKVKFKDAAITGGTATVGRATGIHVPLPPVISFGMNWQVNPAWTVEFVYDFTRWSEFRHLSAKFNPSLPALGGVVEIPGFSVPQNWKDTSTLRLGSWLKLDEKIELRGGIGVDETPIPAKTLSPAIPGADWLTLTAGIGYDCTKNFGVDLGYMAVFYKTRKVTSDALEAGSPLNPVAPGRDRYETFQNLVLLNLRYRF
ncbi:MAG: outer membrane protein transport protein [Deltaproteobacteria bacterium]|nr:outer membrane protein transport protein [Deltaproteobacteria bacterium]